MRAYSVAWMPRIIGVRCGMKTSLTGVLLPRQALQDLGPVPVPADAVGREIVRGLGKHQARLRLASRAR